MILTFNIKTAGIAVAAFAIGFGASRLCSRLERVSYLYNACKSMNYSDAVCEAYSQSFLTVKEMR